ncbi:hypothetical protein GCM10010399_08560 [Dactylosporangium fulvum]
MHVTLLSDGMGGRWAFGPRVAATPAPVYPAQISCRCATPPDIDAATVARAITTRPPQHTWRVRSDHGRRVRSTGPSGVQQYR